jgi:hypothetical protein
MSFLRCMIDMTFNLSRTVLLSFGRILTRPDRHVLTYGSIAGEGAQDRRLWCIVWCGNGDFAAWAFCDSALKLFAGSWRCEERSLALFYGKTYSHIVSSLTTRTGSSREGDGGCLLYVG